MRTIGVVLTPILVYLGRRVTVKRGLLQLQSVFTTPNAVEMYFKVHSREQMGVAKGKQNADPVERIGDEFRRFQTPSAYLLAAVPLSILAGSAVWIATNAGYASITGHEGEAFGVPFPAVAALMGAFVWSLYEIFRHEADRDLTPQAIWEIVIRYLAAIPIGYALTALSQSQNIGAALAFGATAFPMKDLRYFIRERVIRAIGTEAKGAGALEGRSTSRSTASAPRTSRDSKNTESLHSSTSRTPIRFA